MKTIRLTQEQVAIVDDGYWFEYLNQWKWFAKWNKTTQSFYAMRNEGKWPHQKTILMHRVVAQTPDGMWCDHIHHNTLDNREKELRNVTVSQSNMNIRVRKDSPTGIVGVYRRKNRSGYIARLNFEGKYVLDKLFPTIEEAISARKEAEKKYFGEFSNSDL